MGKQEVIDYVMTTPNNPNKAVLEGMLEDVSKGGGGTSMIVRIDTDGMTDKTWQEVYDALVDGTSAYIVQVFTDTNTNVAAHAPILMTVGGNGNYGAVMMAISRDGSSVQTGFLIADSADGYLHATTGSGQ